MRPFIEFTEIGHDLQHPRARRCEFEYILEEEEEEEPFLIGWFNVIIPVRHYYE
jgi:hypothetical protein